jgi:hypothetical protein
MCNSSLVSIPKENVLNIVQSMFNIVRHILYSGYILCSTADYYVYYMVFPF